MKIMKHNFFLKLKQTKEEEEAWGTPASDTTIMDQGHQRGIVNTTVLGLIFNIFIFSLWKRGSVEFQEFRE